MMTKRQKTKAPEPLQLGTTESTAKAGAVFSPGIQAGVCLHAVVERGVHITVPPWPVSDSPPPQSAPGILHATWLLATALNELERIIRFGSKYFPPCSAEGDFREQVIHAIGFEVEQLRRVFPKLSGELPTYSMIPEFGGVAGESWSEVALKLGEERWEWMKRSQPRLVIGEDRFDLISREELGDWEYAQRLAPHLVCELSWFRANWVFPALNFEHLAQLLAVESKKVRRSTTAPRKTEPTPADMTIARAVFDALGRDDVKQTQFVEYLRKVMNYKGESVRLNNARKAVIEERKQK